MRVLKIIGVIFLVSVFLYSYRVAYFYGTLDGMAQIVRALEVKKK